MHASDGRTARQKKRCFCHSKGNCVCAWRWGCGGAGGRERIHRGLSIVSLNPKPYTLNLEGLSLVSLVGHSNSGVVDVELCGPRVVE